MGWFWKRKKGGAVSQETDKPCAKDSPIDKIRKQSKALKKFLEENASEESLLRELTNTADPDEMTDEEKDRITRALFPRTLSMIKEVHDTVEKGESVFPARVDDVAPGTPTMDAVSKDSDGRMPSLAKGLPNAIGKGMSPESSIGNKGQYPRYGKNAAIESNGLSLLPDPLNRFPINPRVLKHFQSRVWITYSGCAIIATHELVSRACSIPAEDAMAHGYKVICVSDEHKHTQEHDEHEERFLAEIKKNADKMGLNDVCIRLNYKKKVFGVAVAVPRVSFKKNYKSPTNKKVEYSYADEYDVNAIEPKSFKGFAVKRSFRAFAECLARGTTLRFPDIGRKVRGSEKKARSK